MVRSVFGWVKRDPVIATLFFSLVLTWLVLIGLIVFLVINSNSNPTISQITPTVNPSPTLSYTLPPTITPFSNTPIPNQGRDIAPPPPTILAVSSPTIGKTSLAPSPTKK